MYLIDLDVDLIKLLIKKVYNIKKTILTEKDLN